MVITRKQRLIISFIFLVIIGYHIHSCIYSLKANNIFKNRRQRILLPDEIIVAYYTEKF